MSVRSGDYYPTGRPPFFYDPLTTPNLTAWYRGDSVVISTGVSQWTDKSGNGRHLTQGTGANQPALATANLNGHDVLDLDGVNDNLQSSAILNTFITATAYTIFAVWKIDNFTAGGVETYKQPAIYIDDDGFIGLHIKQSDTKAYAYHWDGADKNTSQTINNTNWFISTHRYDGSNIYLRLGTGNETSIAAGSVQTINGSDQLWTVGRTYDGDTQRFLDGKIAEMIVCNANLSVGARDNVVDYFKDRYAI